MDLARATQPNSQQVNADDLDEPVVVTVTGATEGTDEQPLFLSLAEFPGRTYRPSRSMARVIKAAWGRETDNWTGARRLELFRNPSIKFGPAVVGGIQISKISHIDEPLRVNLTVTKAKRAFFTVQPFPAAPTPPRDESGRDWLAEMSMVNDTDELTVLYKAFVATPGAFNEELKAAFGARGAAIKAAQKPAEEQEELI